MGMGSCQPMPARAESVRKLCQTLLSSTPETHMTDNEVFGNFKPIYGVPLQIYHRFVVLVDT
jgi:hypothetical protein